MVVVERALSRQLGTFLDDSKAGISFFSAQDSELALTLNSGDVLLVLRSSGQAIGEWPVQVWLFGSGSSAS